MPDLNITISDDSQAFVREQIARGSFSSPSDFLENLVEEAKLKAERTRIDALIVEGLDSGAGSEATPEYWRQIKAELARKYDRADKP
jgi:antitoxin ParD1/3/4